MVVFPPVFIFYVVLDIEGYFRLSDFQAFAGDKLDAHVSEDLV